MAFTAAERENRRLNAADKYAQVTAKEKELRDYNREKQAELRTWNMRKCGTESSRILKRSSRQSV